MTDNELTAALRRNMMETGNLVCLGCGHEHGCSARGCAILREAADRLEAGLQVRQEPNPPLTLDELRKMDGEFVWLEPMQQWRLVYADHEDGSIRLYTVYNTVSAKSVLNDDGRMYRRKPKEGTK